MSRVSLSTASRKFLRGPRGTGFLYVSDRALKRGDYPLFVDMAGAKWLDADDLFYLGFHFVEQTHRAREFGHKYTYIIGGGPKARHTSAQHLPAA